VSSVRIVVDYSLVSCKRLLCLICWCQTKDIDMGSERYITLVSQVSIGRYESVGYF